MTRSTIITLFVVCDNYRTYNMIQEISEKITSTEYTSGNKFQNIHTYTVYS